MKKPAKQSLLVLVLAVAPVVTLARPIEPGAIEVVDGDTIRAGGRTVRLVGFDTPETGSRARCESERMLAAAASTRLRQLIAGGGLDLEPVACSCPPVSAALPTTGPLPRTCSNEADLA
jgi:endonuclease YncB( thermonuclease family)